MSEGGAARNHCTVRAVSAAMNPLLAATALALTLAACSPAPEAAPDSAETAAAPAPSTTESPGASAGTPAASPSASPSIASLVLTLDGLGDLKLGQGIPTGSRWAERGGQASDTCRIVSSPDYPGVYAIVEDGKIRRITVGERSAVRLVEGIGVGASEAQVRADFAGFRAAPHEYEAAPAKYFTAPGATTSDPALRFEIGEDGKVSLIHVGTMPQLEYVEGCA